jgi:hypothetical protein
MTTASNADVERDYVSRTCGNCQKQFDSTKGATRTRCKDCRGKGYPGPSCGNVAEFLMCTGGEARKGQFQHKKVRVTCYRTGGHQGSHRNGVKVWQHA